MSIVALRMLEELPEEALSYPHLAPTMMHGELEIARGVGFNGLDWDAKQNHEFLCSGGEPSLCPGGSVGGSWLFSSVAVRGLLLFSTPAALVRL